MGTITEERVSHIVSLPTPQQPMPILDAALLAHRAGLCVLPPREDGSKAPMADWRRYQHRLSTEEEIRRWYGRGLTGLGLVCGEISGHLEMLEFEGRAVDEGLWQEFKQAAAQTGLGDLLERIKLGYGERSPSGGLHLLYRCPDGVDGNLELAKRPPTLNEAADDEQAAKRPSPRVLIETRGEGGYVIVAPSFGRVHHSGRDYSLVYGGFDSIVTISAAERAALLELARSLDRMPLPKHDERQQTAPGSNVELRPGSDFNGRADWATDILVPAGWSLTGTDREGRQRWYRAPNGRRDWTSATVSPDGEILYVFSTSTELPTGVGLSKFAAYTHLNHAGDFRAAAGALRGRGYGQQIIADVAASTNEDADSHVVVCTDRGLRDRDGEQGMADDALRALLAANAEAPSVFERGRRLVRVGHSQAGPDGSGHPVIERFGKAALAGELARAAWFVTVGARARRPQRVSPPPGIVEDILERGTWDGLPSLSGVVETPVVRPDGSILSQPGYDRRTWLVYAPRPGFVLPPISDTPSTADVRQAIELLNDAFCDFPFADPASRANAYALLLTPFIRHAIGDALVPMAIIDAPTPGTGKGLLLDLTTVISTGSVVPKRSPARDGDEWRKELFAAALEGANYFVIDNAAEPLGAAALDSAITAGWITSRILGESRQGVAAIRWTWVATGNNIVVRGDLARRCYWIRMVSPVADPSKRTGFRHPELLPWAQENRARLIGAVLTLVRAWFIAGQPPAETPAFGSFERWTSMVGGILGHVGVEGFLANLDNFRKRVDRSRDEWETFVAAWWALLRSVEVTIGELTRRLLEDQAYVPLRDALPGSLSRQFDRARGESSRGFATALGRALTEVEGRRFGEPPLMFVKSTDVRGKLTTWRLVDPGTADSTTGPIAGPAGPLSGRSGPFASTESADATSADRGQTGPAGPADREVSAQVDYQDSRGSAGPGLEVRQRSGSLYAPISSSETRIAGPAGPAGPVSPRASGDAGAHVNARSRTRMGPGGPAGPAGPASQRRTPHEAGHCDVLQQAAGGVDDDSSGEDAGSDDWEVWRP